MKNRVLLKSRVLLVSDDSPEVNIGKLAAAFEEMDLTIQGCESEHGESTDDYVRTAAYYLWEKAGKPSGRDQEFWLQAQHDLFGDPYAALEECEREARERAEQAWWQRELKRAPKMPPPAPRKPDPSGHESAFSHYYVQARASHTRCLICGQDITHFSHRL